MVGKGKTGSEVIQQLKEDALLAVCDTQRPLTLELAQKASCIIVFVPTGAFESIKPLLIESKKPVVIGTTRIDVRHVAVKAPWIIGSNFSIGMNMLYQWARRMPQEWAYDVHIEETHHIHKKDSPSGTALYLKSLFSDFDISIDSKREGDVKGEHTLLLNLEGETLKATHTVLDRSVFAKGAILAAHNISKFLPGIYRFEEIFETFFPEILKH